MSKDFNKQEVLERYYANNATKFRKLVDKILVKYGGTTLKDYDDFYSIANEVFADSLKRFDNRCKFKTFLWNCLENKFKSELTRRNRDKRAVFRKTIVNGKVVKEVIPDVSLDSYIINDGSNDVTLRDVIYMNGTVEDKIFRGDEIGCSKKMMEYLNRLSTLQKNVLQLLSIGYSDNEIKEELHINTKQYSDCCAAIYSYRNIECLL